MHRKLFAVCLLFSILFAATAFGAAEYMIPYDGVLFEAYFLSDGDLLVKGSFARQTEEGDYGDTFARLKPDGTEVWTLELSLPDDGIPGGNTLTPLPDGSYWITHVIDKETPRAFSVDHQGELAEISPFPFMGQLYYALSDCVISIDPNVIANGIRLTWYDYGGQEIRQKDYDLDVSQDSALKLLETENNLYLMAQIFNNPTDTRNTLMMLGKDGLLRWRESYDSPYPYFYISQPDSDGGLLLIGDNGTYDDNTSYPDTIKRIGADRQTIWEKEMKVGKWIIRWNPAMTADGIQMIWEKESTFQIVTLNDDGEIKKGAILDKPNKGLADTKCWIYGQILDQEGQLWLYYIVIEEINIYDSNVKSFFQRLDSFAVHEGN